MDEKQHLLDMLALLQQDCMRAAQPYIDRLAAMQAMKTPPPIYISIDHAVALGLIQPKDEKPMKKYMHDMEYAGYLEDQEDMYGSFDAPGSTEGDRLPTDTKGVPGKRYRKIKTVTSVRYKVLFGPGEDHERACRTFAIKTEAVDFFRAKLEQGVRVDFERITTAETTLRSIPSERRYE